MIRNISILLLILSIPFLGNAQKKFKKLFLFNNKLEILAPKGFHPMTEEEQNFKYSNLNFFVSLILTDKSLETNLLINHMTEYELNNEDIPAFKDIQLEKIKKRYPTAKFLENSIKQINGKKVAVIKTITPADDQTIFNYLVITNLEGKVLLLTFNCLEKDLSLWKKPADKIMSSLKLTE